jgi:predicted CxxxxCH...CXXCH cytochrome family protein
MTLATGPLHLNGRVDLGDGSGGCGACHGQGDDPWPSSAAHASHKTPTLAAPTACATCHMVPPAVLSPGHLDGIVEVALSGRALDRGSQATWDGRSCSMVACHGNALVDPPSVVPAWADKSGAASQCGACHGIPPSQHTASTSCDRSGCHGSEVTRSISGTLTISEAGRALHVNGAIDAER